VVAARPDLKTPQHAIKEEVGLCLKAPQDKCKSRGCAANTEKSTNAYIRIE